MATASPLSGDRGRRECRGGALIEAAVKAGVRYFIFSSTAAVYGNPQRVPVREDDPTVPTSPYGSSKLMSEIMLRDDQATNRLALGRHHRWAPGVAGSDVEGMYALTKTTNLDPEALLYDAFGT